MNCVFDNWLRQFFNFLANSAMVIPCSMKKNEKICVFMRKILIFEPLNPMIMITEKDLQQLSERNITENQVINQVAQLKRGTQYVQLMRPATPGDGILRMDEEQVNMMTAGRPLNRY